MNILVVSNSFSPTVEINFTEPLKDLYESGSISAWAFKETKSVKLEDVAWASVVFLVRDYSEQAIALILACRALKKKILYLLDDNLGYLPIEIPLGKVAFSENALQKIPLIVGLVDQTLVQNKIMKSEFSIFGATRLFPQWVKMNPKESAVKHLEDKADQEYKIIYATARKLEAKSELELVNNLGSLAKRRKFTFSSFTTMENETKFKTSRLKRTRSLSQYYSILANGGFAVGVAPLDRNHFYNSKTEAKFRDYAQCSIAGVYSNVPPYSDVIIDGVDGLLVPGIYTSWEEAIGVLLDNVDLRNQIINNARSKVNENYDYGEYKEVLLSLAKSFSSNSRADYSRFAGHKAFLTVCTLDFDTAAQKIADKLVEYHPEIVSKELQTNAPLTPVLIYSCQYKTRIQNYNKIFSWTKEIHSETCTCGYFGKDNQLSIYALDASSSILLELISQIPDSAFKIPKKSSGSLSKNYKDLRFYLEMRMKTRFGRGQGKRP